MRGRRIAVALVAAGALLGPAGCSSVTPGVAHPAEPVPGPTSTGAPPSPGAPTKDPPPGTGTPDSGTPGTGTPGGGTPGGGTPDGGTSESPPPEGGTGPSGPPPSRSTLAADVLDDECLLDALGFSDLLGVAVLPPSQQTVTRTDGSAGTACYASAARGAPEPLAAINVYEPRTGTPAQFINAGSRAGRRNLTGVGEAAVLVDTAPGTTLQAAHTRYLVTITVLDGAPSDDAWRAAALAALAALPA